MCVCMCVCVSVYETTGDSSVNGFTELFYEVNFDMQALSLFLSLGLTMDYFLKKDFDDTMQSSLLLKAYCCSVNTSI